MTLRFTGRGRRLAKTSLRTDVAISGTITSSSPILLDTNDTTHQITYSAINVDGQTVTPISVVWVSSDTGVVTVNASSGLVTKVGAGTATITGQLDGWRPAISVTVNGGAVAVDHIDVAPATASLNPDGQVQLEFTAYDASNNVLQGRTATWSSANAAIASVNASTGLVTAEAVGGPINITATCETKTDTCAVTVNASVLEGYPYTGSGLITSFRAADYADTTALSAAGIMFCYASCAETPSVSPPAGVVWDVTTDSFGLFGKRVRYIGNTNPVNPDRTDVPGRTPVAKFPLQAAGYAHIWARYFYMYDATWTLAGANPVGANESYKESLFSFSSSPAPMPSGARLLAGYLNGNKWRMEFHPGNGVAKTETVLVEYGSITGDQKDVQDMFHTNAGDGSAQIWECVIGFERKTTKIAYGTMARRKYTVAGAINPQSWNGSTIKVEITDSNVWNTLNYFNIGQNRNKWYSGSHNLNHYAMELVDGSVQSNPFGLTGYPA